MFLPYVENNAIHEVLGSNLLNNSLLYECAAVFVNQYGVINF